MSQRCPPDRCAPLLFTVHETGATSEAEPGATIRKTATSDAEQRALLGETARAFLGLS